MVSGHSLTAHGIFADMEAVASSKGTPRAFAPAARSPLGAWAPSGVSAEQANALQNLAWQSVSNYYNSASTPSMDQCQAVMRDEVCNAYASYSGNTGVAAGCIGRFTQQAQTNPFYYSAASDSGYWFP